MSAGSKGPAVDPCGRLGTWIQGNCLYCNLHLCLLSLNVSFWFKAPGMTASKYHYHTVCTSDRAEIAVNNHVWPWRWSADWEEVQSQVTVKAIQGDGNRTATAPTCNQTKAWSNVIWVLKEIGLVIFEISEFYKLAAKLCWLVRLSVWYSKKVTVTKKIRNISFSVLLTFNQYVVAIKLL